MLNFCIFTPNRCVVKPLKSHCVQIFLYKIEKLQYCPDFIRKNIETNPPEGC